MRLKYGYYFHVAAHFKIITAARQVQSLTHKFNMWLLLMNRTGFVFNLRYQLIVNYFHTKGIKWLMVLHETVMGYAFIRGNNLQGFAKIKFYFFTDYFVYAIVGLI
jgi:hypothetical protein